jgi:hypothetical protein
MTLLFDSEQRRIMNWRAYSGDIAAVVLLLESGYYDTQAWGALRKCWKGYRIAKSQGDINKMRYYAKGVQKFEELRIDLTQFPQLGIYSIDVSHEEQNDKDMNQTYNDTNKDETY